jgi:hypothetical protein
MEDTSVQANQTHFEAEVALGTARQYVERHGSAIISNKRLTLRKGSGDVLVEAPISEVWALNAPRSRKGAVRIFIRGDAYTIERPWRFVRTRSWVTSYWTLKKRRALARQFLGAVEAGGGHLGKPDLPPKVGVKR